MKKNYYFREDFVAGENQDEAEENHENSSKTTALSVVANRGNRRTISTVVKTPETGEKVKQQLYPELYFG